MFKDLPPQKDPKGGSPRTPTGGIPLRDYEQFPQNPQPAAHPNGNGVWKPIATGLGGICMGLLLAWFTAWQGRGVSQEQMAVYVRDNGPYIYDRPSMVEHNRQQDEKITTLIAGESQVNSRLNALENYNAIDVREKQEFKDNQKLIKNALEELLKGRR